MMPSERAVSKAIDMEMRASMEQWRRTVFTFVMGPDPLLNDRVTRLLELEWNNSLWTNAPLVEKDVLVREVSDMPALLELGLVARFHFRIGRDVTALLLRWTLKALIAHRGRAVVELDEIESVYGTPMRMRLVNCPNLPRKLWRRFEWATAVVYVFPLDGRLPDKETIHDMRRVAIRGTRLNIVFVSPKGNTYLQEFEEFENVKLLFQGKLKYVSQWMHLFSDEYFARAIYDAIAFGGTRRRNEL